MTPKGKNKREKQNIKSTHKQQTKNVCVRSDLKLQSTKGLITN